MAKNDIEITAINGMVTISTANSNLDGTGTMGSVISGSGNGRTRIDRVYIKATGDVTQGMVRLFLDDGSNTRLFREIMIPEVNQRGVTPAFQEFIRFPKGLFLSETWTLKASTQNAETFNIIAEGKDWDYPVSGTNIEYSADNGMTTVSTANTNLDGTGTLSTLITGDNKGNIIDRIYIKATGDVSLGMIRLFLDDGTSTKLFTEVPIKEFTQESTIRSFSKVINFKNGFMLEADWSIKVSTQVAETFVITAESSTWDYV